MWLVIASPVIVEIVGDTDGDIEAELRRHYELGRSCHHHGSADIHTDAHAHIGGMGLGKGRQGCNGQKTNQLFHDNLLSDLEGAYAQDSSRSCDHCICHLQRPAAKKVYTHFINGEAREKPP